MFKFYVNVFYMMGKALSGELSCMQTGLVQCILKAGDGMASSVDPYQTAPCLQKIESTIKF